MRRAGYHIDWRQQFSAILPFAESKNGVIRVDASRGAPTAAFTRVLRQYLSYRKWPKPWRTVQVDPSNSNTHYIEDVVDQVSMSTGARLEPARHVPYVSIGEHNSAGGNVIVKEIDVRIPDGPRTHELVQSLCASLKRTLETHRIALIFLDSHRFSHYERCGLSARLWYNGLEDLVDDGLLIVDISDPEELDQGSPWPPDPTAFLELPANYGEAERLAAQEDLAALALSHGVYNTASEAEAFASTVLAYSMNIREVHVRLAKTIAELGGANVQ